MFHETHLEDGLPHVNCSVSLLSLKIVMWEEDDRNPNQYLTVRMENGVEVRDLAMEEAVLLCHKMRYK